MVSEHQKRREPAENGKIVLNTRQDAYVLSEISKSAIKIFLAQISMKLQIWLI